MASMDAAKEQIKPRKGAGKWTYKTVERLIAANGISESEAIRRIASETGRSAAAVSASYYIRARMVEEGRAAAPTQLAAVPPALGSAAGTAAATRRRTTVWPQATSRAHEIAQELILILREREKELANLRWVRELIG